MQKNYLKWFDFVRHESIDALVRRVEILNIGQVKRVKDRTEKTCMEVIRNDTDVVERLIVHAVKAIQQ